MRECEKERAQQREKERKQERAQKQERTKEGQREREKENDVNLCCMYRESERRCIEFLSFLTE